MFICTDTISYVNSILDQEFSFSVSIFDILISTRLKFVFSVLKNFTILTLMYKYRFKLFMYLDIFQIQT